MAHLPLLLQLVVQHSISDVQLASIDLHDAHTGVFKELSQILLQQSESLVHSVPTIRHCGANVVSGENVPDSTNDFTLPGWV